MVLPLFSKKAFSAIVLLAMGACSTEVLASGEDSIPWLISMFDRKEFANSSGLPGYLSVPRRRSIRTEPAQKALDRRKIVSLSSLEDVLDADQKRKHDEMLDEAHKRNLEKANESNTYRVDSNPPPEVLKKENIQQAPLTPEEVLIFFDNDKKRNTKNNNSDVVVPFQMPFQNRPAVLPMPSRSIYERR